ncbi:LamG-like jellyroll fold domain-containing protein OS=Streptomyces microflavus OX=1919 GN=Smic_22170 PE=4 SV=1 [Streptomyces microflavus]
MDFLVAAGAGPVGRWRFDEADGVAKDAATADGADDATLAGGAVRDNRGRRGLLTHDSSGNPLANPVTDKGLSLNGTTGYAATGGPALETRVRLHRFRLGPARPHDRRGNHGLALQDGARYSPFILSYSKDVGRWFFGVKETEATAVGYFGIAAKNPPVVGVSHTSRVPTTPSRRRWCCTYNGVSQGKRTAKGAWQTSGALQIGRLQVGRRPPVLLPRQHRRGRRPAEGPAAGRGRR